MDIYNKAIINLFNICKEHKLAFLWTETHDIIIGDWTDVLDSYYIEEKC